MVKHAGVRHATLLARHDRGGAQVFVADEGIGTGGARDGFGVSRSIRERMVSVGGGALTGPGPTWSRDSCPARVASQAAGRRRPRIWPPPGHCPHRPYGRHPARRDSQRPDHPRVARVRPSVAGPGCSVRPRGGGGGCHPASAMGLRVGSAEVVAACATYVLVGAVALLADPYCASLLGEGVMLDARAPMMAVILLLAPSPGGPGVDRLHGRVRAPRGRPGVVRSVDPVWTGHGRGGGLCRGGSRGVLALHRAH